MIYEIYQLLKYIGDYSLKDTVNLIIYLQDCNANYDDLNRIMSFIKDCSDENIKNLINQSKNEYIA